VGEIESTRFRGCRGPKNEENCMVEELLGVEGNEIDLRLLSSAFPTETPRLEKRKVTANGDERYFLILESETGREDEEVLTDGRRVLAEMTAIMLADGPGPPQIAQKRSD
jgi:hypothetical protein